jgi:TPR repeat protein
VYDLSEDYGEAMKWYRKAADQGDLFAQFGLGSMYDNGEGGVLRSLCESGDLSESVEFLPRDQQRLRRVVPQDYGEAAKWYRKACADQGYAPAQFALAGMYYDGEGVAQDYAEAIRWYRKAAEQGNADAQYNLGLAYGSGVGVAGDLTEAEKWHHKAADQEHSEAQFNLAFYYYSKDYIEAARLWRKAADKGHSEAQYWLGICYQDGEGVPQDYVLAHMWFNLSASNGVGEDQQRRAKARDDVARRLTPQQLAQAQRLAKEWKPG